MSDSLTDAQRVILGALRQKGILAPNDFEHPHATHERKLAGVAVEIDKALGGLRREISKGTRSCSYPGSDGPCEGHAHTRFVTEWEPIR